jgi:hypothetical protein
MIVPGSQQPLGWFHKPPTHGNRQLPGSHLAEGGPYQELVASSIACNRRPVLRHSDWKVPHKREAGKLNSSRAEQSVWEPRSVQGRAACIQLNPEGVYRATREFNNSAGSIQDLDATLNEPLTPGRKRIFVLESIDPRLVEVLGRSLSIDPVVFARHQRTALWEFPHLGGNGPPLSSQRNTLLSLMMEYSELRYFSATGPANDNIRPDPVFENSSARNPADHRHIGITKVNSEFQNVGLLHRKATYWARIYEGFDNAWDGEEVQQ